MLNSVLDTIIAIVVVLLVLSLIVQSIQTTMKKLFKIKCRQIEDSLVDLFESACQRGVPEIKPKSILMASPMIRALVRSTRSLVRAIPRIVRRSTAAEPISNARLLTDAVSQKFIQAGRVAQSGKVMLDSLTKEDLMKVLQRIAPGLLSDGNQEKVKDVIQQYQNLVTIINEIEKLYGQLSGDSNSKFAAVQQALTATLNDIDSVLLDGYPSESRPNSLVEDLLNLRHFDAFEVQKLIGEIQKQVDDDIAKAPEDKKPALTQISTQLKNLSAAVMTLNQKLDATLAPLKQKLSDIENWYDTVMVGFEERYNRSMRTWAIVIGFVVVVLLNADFFRVTRSISQNDLVRNQLVAYGDEMTRKKDDVQKAQNDLAATRAQISSSTPERTPALLEQQSREQQQVNDLNATLAEISKAYTEGANTYGGFGFERLHLKEVKWWWKGWFAKDTDIPAKIRRNLIGLAGWLVTTMLVSVGAPFWQDTLESLFGIKNLLRKKGAKKEPAEQTTA